LTDIKHDQEDGLALLLAIGTFLIVACVAFVFWLMAGGGAAKRNIVQERLEAVRQVEPGRNATPGVSILRDETLSTVPVFDQILKKWVWPEKLKKFVTQAGLTIKPIQILLWSAVLGVAGYFLAGSFISQTILCLIAAGLIALAPLAYIAWMRTTRLTKFEEHLPEALDLMSRAVRSGLSFTAGLELVGKECSEPIAGEFRTTFEEQNLGLSLRDTFINLTERVPLVDVRLLVTALLIQRDTGGNLVEVLNELSRVIRERFKIHREVRVKTAAGKLTAAFLVALPLIMIIMLNFVNPNYVGILFHDPMGQTFLIIAAMMQVVGSLILWKIVNVHV